MSESRVLAKKSKKVPKTGRSDRFVSVVGDMSIIGHLVRLYVVAGDDARARKAATIIQRLNKKKLAKILDYDAKSFVLIVEGYEDPVRKAMPKGIEVVLAKEK